MTFATVTLPIDTEHSDLTAIEAALRAVPGVRRVYLSGVVEMAYIEYDAACCDVRAFETALNDALVSPEAAEADVALSITTKEIGGMGKRLGRLLARLAGHAPRPAGFR